MRQSRINLSATFIIAIAFCLILTACVKRGAQPVPSPGAAVETSFSFEKKQYQVIEGNLYQVGRAGKLDFVEALYDKDFFAKNYEVADGVIYRKSLETGKRYATRRAFHEDFEGAAAITDLMGEKRLWSDLTLQSRRTPTVAEYVKLRQRILKGESGFLDNSVAPGGEVVHGGTRALKATCDPPTRAMICSKASLSMQLLHFVKGDDVWFSGYYYLAPGGKPYTIMDLECTWIKEHPGIRIALMGGDYLGFDMKNPQRTHYRQAKGREVAFPVERWVHVEAHWHLSDQKDGIAELWQDGAKIVEAHGETLPLPSAIYNSMEIGVSAMNHDFNKPTTLYVDDLAIGDKTIK